ncbi:Bug family tripartite tricarboxylate transporter substrate binding protein [Mycetocola reblochoni]|uniref:Tricarboxylate transport protein TctC n=2 Tax=Mycetocola reblochoni TaxID=331618 RepID=A0A1R4JAF9_9MICO|nr:tripartite tricarboxylate transporter substrate-binding protein [Mycetocola reblochoni]RLP70051.1 tripartite tricarboxylate transporter substrate binding protein [Mycetocola reblochoni]SJN28924.1 Tricarboxylate transport protein TctC [Mycetocola reblochoni REB411]
MRRQLTATVVAIATIGLVGAAAVDAGSTAQGASARSTLTLMAPAAPGGGWDTFARESQQALRTNGITNSAQVVNVPGAGGTIGLSQLMQMTGRDDMIMVTGGVMMGAAELSKTPERVEDTTLLARLADDYNVLVVPADSPYDTLEEFVAAWREAPGSTALAGGSLGSIDHLLSGMLAEEAGIAPTEITYIAYPGGGEVLTALLSHTAVAGISGYTDFRDQLGAGTLKALGMSAAEPIDGVDVPTFAEEGLDVSMSNWRGYVAPPGIPDATRDELVQILTEMHDTEQWRDTLARNNWTDTFMTGDELDAFVAEESARVSAIVEELGL